MTEASEVVKKWYIIHTYSGYEKKVCADLEKRVQTLNLTDRVFRIIVPEEEKVEIRRGKKKKVMKKLFPGYVMVEMAVEKEEGFDGIGFRVDSEAWYVIRNTAGVTGFVGVGSEPSPLEEDEVANLLRRIGIEVGKEASYDIDISIGERFTIVDGAFEGSEGEVAGIDYEHSKVKVMVDLFGRMTPVEVDFESVKKV